MKRSHQGISIVALLVALAIIAAIGVVGWYVWRNNDEGGNKTAVTTPPEFENNENKAKASFASPKKGAHFETSTPSHGSTLAAVPVDVVIDFNFDLAGNSSIKINKDGKDYGVGETKVDSGKLGLRRQMNKDAPDGVYTVNYNGCWPDRTCHGGSFQFAINQSLINGYEDKRGQKTITVKMSEIKFQPMNMRISTGTVVSWINDDSVEHYVNTDSHPAHTHVPGLNSKVLSKGQSYSFTFENTGAYPYHCSAHAANMHGNIIVE